MNMNNPTPSPSVQALIASRYIVKPGSITPAEYEALEREAKQITRNINAELMRAETNFQKIVDESRVLSELLAHLRMLNADLRRQTPNNKLPRPYVRVKVDHADEIERHLVRAIQLLNHGDGVENLQSLQQSTCDAYFLARDVAEEARRIRQGE